MILYKNTKVKVRSPDEDTDFFDIVAGVLQGYTLAPYLFIICPDDVLSNLNRSNERNCFFSKLYGRRLHKWHALLANTPTYAESLLHSLEHAAGGIGLRLNGDKTEYMRFNKNKKGDISTLNGGSIKLVDKFTYLGSSVSSTENDINTRLAKAWTAIDRLVNLIR